VRVAFNIYSLYCNLASLFPSFLFFFLFFFCALMSWVVTFFNIHMIFRELLLYQSLQIGMLETQNWWAAEKD